jgi:hypothetical protein
MIQITKTIRVKADYDITRQFDSVEDLLNELREYGYEGEYDEDSDEFNDALNEYFDEPLHTKATANSNNQHYLDNIEIDTENFSTYYTF